MPTVHTIKLQSPHAACVRELDESFSERAQSYEKRRNSFGDYFGEMVVYCVLLNEYILFCKNNSIFAL